MDKSPQELPAPQSSAQMQARPRLLLLTQLLVASRMVASIYALSRVTAAGQLTRAGSSWWQLALSSLLSIVLLVLLGYLSYGLAKVRGWAWSWALIFSVLLTARFIFLAIRHIEQAWTPAHNSSVHFFSAIWATLFFSLLLSWYVYEMYSNTNLRAYFKGRA